MKRLVNNDNKGFYLLLDGFDNGKIWLAPHITMKQSVMENCDWNTINVTDRKLVNLDR